MKIKKGFTTGGDTFLVNADGLSPEELHKVYQDVKKEILSDRETARQFLLSLGSYDENLNLTPLFATGDRYASK